MAIVITAAAAAAAGGDIIAEALTVSKHSTWIPPWRNHHLHHIKQPRGNIASGQDSDLQSEHGLFKSVHYVFPFQQQRLQIKPIKQYNN